MSARQATAALSFALLLLAVLWQNLLDPPQRMPLPLALILHALPLVPAILLFALRRPSAAFAAGVGALFLFCHGVMEAWGNAPMRLWGGIEIALSVALVFASSFDGLRARFAKRRAAR